MKVGVSEYKTRLSAGMDRMKEINLEMTPDLQSPVQAGLPSVSPSSPELPQSDPAPTLGQVYVAHMPTVGNTFYFYYGGFQEGGVSYQPNQCMWFDY
jgi:hypothetical protein